LIHRHFLVSLLPNQPNQPKNGPGRTPARSSFKHRNRGFPAWLSGCVFLLLLCFDFALPVAQPIDGDAVIAPLAKRSLLLDIHGRGEHALAVGEHGHILLTTDNGLGWRQVPVPTRRMLTGVYLVDDRVAWSVGHQSVILKSGDGGGTWAKANAESDPEAAYLDVLFLDRQTGFIVGSYGKILFTPDGGKNWTMVKQEDDPHFSHITPAPDESLWLCGEYGSVWRSTDRAANWQPHMTPYEGTFFGVIPLDKGGAVVFGLRGNIFRSEDGTEWEQVESSTKALLHAGLVLADGRLLLAAGAGQLLISTDAGRTFRLCAIAPDNTATVTSLWQAKDGAVLLTSDKGVIRLELADLKTEAAK